MTIRPIWSILNFFKEKNRINKSKINYSLKFTKKDQIPGHGCLLQVPISVGSPRLQYFGSRTLLVSMDLPKKKKSKYYFK